MKNISILAAGLLAAFAAGAAHASTTSYSFSGVTSLAMGSIPGGTPFTGTFSYDPAATGVSTSYYGGTQNLFANAYSALTMTIGGKTVTEGAPGTMALYNNVNPPNSIPVGDSLYTFNPLNGQGPLHSGGSFTGLTPNFIYLGFVDSSGKVFPGNSLPSKLSLASFNEAFIGINYGPTTTISSLTSLSPVPEPGTWAMMIAGLGILGSAARHRKA